MPDKEGTTGLLAGASRQQDENKADHSQSDVMALTTVRTNQEHAPSFADSVEEDAPGSTCFGDELNFEEIWPELPCHKESFLTGIVGNAVQNGVGGAAIQGAQDAREINPGGDLAGSRRDTRDPIGLPDIGENFSSDKFEFVQLRDERCAIVNRDPPLFPECGWIENADFRGTIAHKEFQAVCG